MLRIHEAIQGGEHPNSKTLSRELEVRPRTIKRDIDFMRFRLNLPIVYDELRWGYRYSKPVTHLPSMAITEAEMFSLLVANKAIAQYQGTPFQRPLETAFGKLTGQLDKETSYSMGSLDKMLSFRPFAPDQTDLEAFQVLTNALQQRRVLRFQYRNLGAERFQPRQVRPYHLTCVDNHWYLLAFDLDRKAMRTFVLTRLRQPEATVERFVVPDDFSPDKHLKGSFAVFKGKGDYEVVVDFDAWATDLIRGRRWHASQELVELPDRGITASVAAEQLGGNGRLDAELGKPCDGGPSEGTGKAPGQNGGGSGQPLHRANAKEVKFYGNVRRRAAPSALESPAFPPPTTLRPDD